ncbi:mitochondria-eating protein isoform X1 [Polypterus senegalus]|uniref:mitochondria-eating protein isoform X1 n=1 Tax=Polypterus senegalus TaxID=55291 RepID=UPI001962D64F|nr:mitochondria-eating protein isoform X1 [Polypterus senegalus]
MADSLRRLVNTSTYSILQDKLESWYKDYHLVSCDQNLNRCCELLELTSKVQGQLFTILNLTAREGGHYAGVDTLKSRFLPWLGSCFSIASSGVTSDTSFSLIQESKEKDMKIRELSISHEHEIKKMETQLNSAQMQLNAVKQELEDAQLDLDETRNKSATTLLATEDEIIQLKADLMTARDEAQMYKRKLDILDDYERQMRMLKDEISILTTEKSLLQDRLIRSRSSSPIGHRSRSPSPLPYLRSESPSWTRLSNSTRQSRMISRFNDIYSIERLDAQSLLKRYIDDIEMVQRIIFIATVESFHAAKMAFRQFRLRVRKTLSPTHTGPESLDDTVMDYIIRNLDLYDVQSSVNDVIRAMNVNPKISFPPEVDFILISSFIREVCRLAFSMQTLEPALDIAFTTDGELFSDNKYRRSYDSEYTAPLVAYHVWPALMEGDSVIVKGEAVTKRGALQWSPRRSRSRSRSTSPVRSRTSSPSRGLSSLNRSASPGRLSPSRL